MTYEINPQFLLLTSPYEKLMADSLERIARAQEGMLAIAAEARQERLKLSAKLQEALKRPLQEKEV